MSKRKQTENLHLYAYELTTSLPTLLKDWSDNMAILDGAHASVLSLIGALDERLTTAEGTLEDLSPESIQDYKIRLDALEKKVVINTNGIKDVNTKIATVNAQINTINAEQIVQNNRLTAIETLGASHTELINALRTDLTGVDGRVTTLEQCCENVQHEITDIQHDIDGFNDDVTALATQVQTLSTAVTELTELVNSLQLDVVSQRLDSFEASLTELTSRVATAESNITAHGATLEEHNTRITANENNIENIDTEIGNTDYSEIGDTVSSSLVELADRIRALTPQEYDVLVSRLNTVETEVGDIEDAVDNLDSSVSALQTSVASKANASDVTLLQSDINVLQSDVSTLQTNVNSKADNSDLTALSTLVGNSLDVTDPDEGAGIIKFGVDADGNYGYKKVGADTVTPFKTGDNNGLIGVIASSSYRSYGNQPLTNLILFTDKVGIDFKKANNTSGDTTMYINSSWEKEIDNTTIITRQNVNIDLSALIQLLNELFSDLFEIEIELKSDPGRNTFYTYLKNKKDMRINQIIYSTTYGKNIYDASSLMLKDEYCYSMISNSTPNLIGYNGVSDNFPESRIYNYLFVE